MAKIKFERLSAPIGSVEFSRNPSITGGYLRSKKYLQPKDFSDGGDIYIYDKGIAPKTTITLNWPNIPKTDYDNFMTFLNVVVASKYTFTFIDFDNFTYTARISNSNDIRSAPVATNRESLTVELLVNNVQ